MHNKILHFVDKQKKANIFFLHNKKRVRILNIPREVGRDKGVGERKRKTTMESEREKREWERISKT